MNKSRYLFVNDYGSGGIWVYINAKNPSDVTKKYPGLKYSPSKPEWLEKFEQENTLPEYDIEENPEKLEFLRNKEI
jgi:hypothetical protein